MSIYKREYDLDPVEIYLCNHLIDKKAFPRFYTGYVYANLKLEEILKEAKLRRTKYLPKP